MSLLRKMFTTNLSGTKPKPSVLKSIISSPDDFKLIAWVENGELNIKIKKKGEKIDGSN